MFKAVSAASIRPAAIAQDRIGWMNFTEGKISKQLRQLLAARYQSTHSRHTANQWAAGLVTTLLSMVHSQWTHRCNILHPCDAQGLCLWEANALGTAINFQFQSSLDGLRPRDHHLISRGKDWVLQMTGSGKLSWLSSIHIAWSLYTSQIAQEAKNIQNFMTNYLTTPWDTAIRTNVPNLIGFEIIGWVPMDWTQSFVSLCIPVMETVAQVTRRTMANPGPGVSKVLLLWTE
jgi:hypothetical protein